MEAHLDILERKIDQVATLCQALRQDNDALRTQLARVEAERLALANKMQAASERLSVLLQNLPES